MTAVFTVTDLSLTFYIIFCNAIYFVSLLFLEYGCVYKTVFPGSKKKE